MLHYVLAELVLTSLTLSRLCTCSTQGWAGGWAPPRSPRPRAGHRLQRSCEWGAGTKVSDLVFPVFPRSSSVFLCCLSSSPKSKDLVCSQHNVSSFTDHVPLDIFPAYSTALVLTLQILLLAQVFLCPVCPTVSQLSFCPCVVIYYLCTYFNTVTKRFCALARCASCSVTMLENIHMLLQVVQVLSRALLSGRKAGIQP